MEEPMDGQPIAVRITFDELTRGEANRAAQDLREAILQRTGGDVAVSLEREDAESQDAGSTLVLLFGAPAAVAIAQGIRAYLARRTDSRDHITIKTADGTEVVATGEAARQLDAAALVRATRRTRKG
jgi:F420-0:gamma-glutamyl ligase-like protein